MAILDKYANIFTAELTMSAADTISFTEIPTGLGIESDRQSARAMIIDELDYYPNVGLYSLMTSVADYSSFGLTITNTVPDLNDVSDRRILHSCQRVRADFGIAAAAAIMPFPLVYQFFPPLITAERKLYLAMDTNGLASASQVKVRAYYRIVEINQADFIELAEVFRLVG